MTSKTKPKNILELQKIALQDNSQDKTIFKEELVKSVKLLTATDILILYNWLEENYLITHCDIINDVFYKRD